jgi:hypothetical protein
MHFLYLANVLLIHTYTCVRSKFTAGNKQCARATAATVIHVYKKERQNKRAAHTLHTRSFKWVLIDRILKTRVIGRCLTIVLYPSIALLMKQRRPPPPSLRAFVWGVLIYKVLGMHAFRIS